MDNPRLAPHGVAATRRDDVHTVIHRSDNQYLTPRRRRDAGRRPHDTPLDPVTSRRGLGLERRGLGDVRRLLGVAHRGPSLRDLFGRGAEVARERRFRRP